MDLVIGPQHIGKLRESEALDFKKLYWRKADEACSECGRREDEVAGWTWQLELAKDIAALANTLGGHIVVGATESKNLLSGFIDPKLPKNWETGFSEVIGAFMIPSPIVLAEVQNLDPTKTHKQLIVRVEPSEQPVVVHRPGDKRQRLSLPIRYGHQTVPLPVARAIMVLSNPFRRWYLKFLTIAGADAALSVLTDQPGGGAYECSSRPTRIVDVGSDSVVLDDGDGPPLVLPFDYIEAVWQPDPAKNSWQVRVRGVFHRKLFKPRYR